MLVTSKVVSKAEGRALAGTDRVAAVEAELAEPGARVVARRGPTTIVRTRLGPDDGRGRASTPPTSRRAACCSCRSTRTAAPGALRRAVAERTGANVGVVVTDTAGRAWRTGQTDIAIGAAGLVVLDDHAGRTDAHGNELAVTAPALADELAGAAELAQGKLAGRPFALVRGRAGPGAAARRRRPGRGGAGPRRRARTCSGTAPARPWSGRWPATRPTGCPSVRPRRAEEVAAAVTTGPGRRAPSPSTDGLVVRRGPAAGAAGVRARLAIERCEEGPEKAVIRPVTP